MTNLKLRRINSNDIELLFLWANDKLVRENAFNQKRIEWENHLKWFDKMYSNNNCILLILELNEKPLGQIRFDKSHDDDIWQIDYSIATEFRGRGLGKELIRKGLIYMYQHYPNTIIIAKVKAVNIPSIKVFTQLGFDSKKINGLIEFSFRQKIEI